MASRPAWSARGRLLESASRCLPSLRGRKRRRPRTAKRRLCRAHKQPVPAVQDTNAICLPATQSAISLVGFRCSIVVCFIQTQLVVAGLVVPCTNGSITGWTTASTSHRHAVFVIVLALFVVFSSRFSQIRAQIHARREGKSPPPWSFPDSASELDATSPTAASAAAALATASASPTAKHTPVTPTQRVTTAAAGAPKSV